MKLRLVLPLLLALLIAGDAHAQYTTTPTVPGGNLCAPRVITYASTTQGRISQAGGVGCHLLDGVAGERVRLRPASITPGFSPSVSIARPGGGSACSGTRPTCTLPVTGRYSVTVSGTGTGRYELSAQRVSNPIGCAPLTPGNSPSPTTLVAGGQPCYRVAGVPGMRLRLRLVQLTGATDLFAEVLRPDGTTVCTASRVDDSTCARFSFCGSDSIPIRRYSERRWTLIASTPRWISDEIRALVAGVAYGLSRSGRHSATSTSRCVCVIGSDGGSSGSTVVSPSAISGAR